MQRGWHTLLDAVVEPHSAKPRIPLIVLVDDKVKGVLEGDLAAILLTEQGADDWARLLPQGMAGDVIGDGEEDKWVEDGGDGVGGLEGREERVCGGRHPNNGGGEKGGRRGGEGGTGS